MEKIKNDIQEITMMKEQLQSEQLEKINFDNLITQLDKISSAYNSYLHTQNEMQTLRQNIVSKISQMEKAIHVVSRKRPNKEELEQKLQYLTKLNSEELLQKFEKVESKFHAAFPSTFQVNAKYKNKINNYASYK